MTRAARLAPTLLDVEPGRDAYVLPATLRRFKKRARASWWLRGELLSLQREDGSYLKNALHFSDHYDNHDAFFALLDECASMNCPRPSGYPAPFHEKFRTPSIPWTVNAMFLPQFAGGWQEAIEPGIHKGPAFRYDLRSAYLSALQDTLPDPNSYHYSEDIRKPGLYVIEHTPRPGLPYPFSDWPVVNATPDEIDVYGLSVKRVLKGIAWTQSIATDPIRKVFEGMSFWKQAARSYWGRWAMQERVECVRPSGVTPMHSRFSHLPWAHVLVSRVRMRLYHEVIRGDVLHVYVDSIISKGRRPIGAPTQLGTWKLEYEYLGGVVVLGPGHYGPLGGAIEKWAGLRKDDPRRKLYASQ